MPRPILLTVLAFGLATPALSQDKPAGTDFASFSHKAGARMMAADINGDGKLSRDEFTAITEARGGKREGLRMFDRMDANKDGALDQTELNGLLARRFARMDANHDGELTAGERQAMRGTAADPEQ